MVDHLTLLSLGAYTRMFQGWRPESIEVPTLSVRVLEPLPGMPREWRSSWPGVRDTVDTAGTHPSVLEEDTVTTAKAVRDWIDALVQSRTKPNIYVGDMRNEINVRTWPIAPCYY